MNDDSTIRPAWINSIKPSKDTTKLDVAMGLWLDVYKFRLANPSFDSEDAHSTAQDAAREAVESLLEAWDNTEKLISERKERSWRETFQQE